jgi:three-Cys-motif partner protein
MARKPMSDREWLAKHLTPLMDAGKTLFSKSGSLTSNLQTYDKGGWTGLKLILEKNYITPYLEILAGRGRKVAYVDLFAGPGLNLLGTRKVPVPGSPLIPLMLRSKAHQFSAFVFSEIDPVRVDSLTKRVSMIENAPLDKIKILREDANEVVEQLPKILGDAGVDHALVLIDPEGFEFQWRSMKKLTECINCDLIINFPSSGLTRNLHLEDTARSVRSFLGPGSDDIPESAGEDWAIQTYRRNLASIGKDVSTEIIVKSGSAYHYHLIPAVRATKGGSPWFRVLLQTKERIERFSGPVLEMVADQIDGKLGSLDSMFE